MAHSYSDIMNITEKLIIKKCMIKNEMLRKESHYNKLLYLGMLGTIATFFSYPTEEQKIFLKRILLGIEFEENYEFVIRKSFYADMDLVSDFSNVFKEKNLKYNFLLDALIMANLGNTNKIIYCYITNLMEILDITNKNIVEISKLAKSILKQDESLLNNGEEINLEIYIYDYIKSYKFGIMENSNKKLHIRYKDKEKIKMSELTELYDLNKNIIIFENATIVFDKKVLFRGSEKVIFKKCEFVGEGNSIELESIGTVTFERCEMHDFTNRIAEIKHCGNIEISNCKIYKCSNYSIGVYSYDSSTYEYNMINKKIDIEPNTYYLFGGVFEISGDVCNEIKIINNKVTNIEMRLEIDSENKFCKGIFLQIDRMAINLLQMEGNEFYGCRATDIAGDIISSEIINTSKPQKIINNNNVISGGENIICRFYM